MKIGFIGYGSMAEALASRWVGHHEVVIGELKYARLLEAAASIVIKLLFSGCDPHTVLNLIQPEVQVG